MFKKRLCLDFLGIGESSKWAASSSACMWPCRLPNGYSTFMSDGHPMFSGLWQFSVFLLSGKVHVLLSHFRFVYVSRVTLKCVCVSFSSLLRVVNTQKGKRLKGCLSISTYRQLWKQHCFSFSFRVWKDPELGHTFFQALRWRSAFPKQSCWPCLTVMSL